MSATQNNDLISAALERMANKLEATSKQLLIPPAEWLEKYYWIPEPVDPVTGEPQPPGPIVLIDHQRRIINEALSKKPNGMFKYTNIIYSATKKSGKSAITAGVALYMAHTTPFGKIYCLANDGKQSDDRLFGPIAQCIKFHKKNNLILSKAKVTAFEATALLENEAQIEAIPCDAAGEAGSEPTGVFISEAWAYTTEKKRKLFTELTVSPTKYGRAIRWIESYAGYMGESELLWNLYDLAVLQGVPHPDFSDLTSEGKPVVWVNEAANMFCYWDHEPRLIWQGQEYYSQEARILVPSEFQRIHRNHWVSSVGAFIQPEWWDACQDETLTPLLDDRTPVVVGIDAAETNDCAAIVAVTRDPNRPETDVAIRGCRIFKPVPGKSVVLLEETLGKTIQEWGAKWNIVCIPYDAFQMAKMVQDYRRGQVTIDPKELEGMSPEEIQEHLKKIQRAIQRWYYKFSQQSVRAVADKQLHDMVVNRQIHWNPNDRDSDISARGDDETLTKHMKQAGVAQDRGQYRIQKLSDKLKTDAAVALSMATERCLALILDNRENDDNTIEQLYHKKLISYEEYMRRKIKATLGKG